MQVLAAVRSSQSSKVCLYSDGNNTRELSEPDDDD